MPGSSLHASCVCTRPSIDRALLPHPAAAPFALERLGWTKKADAESLPRLLRHPGQLSWRGADPESRLTWDSATLPSGVLALLAPKGGMVMTESFSGLNGGGESFGKGVKLFVCDGVNGRVAREAA